MSFFIPLHVTCFSTIDPFLPVEEQERPLMEGSQDKNVATECQKRILRLHVDARERLQLATVLWE